MPDRRRKKKGPSMSATRTALLAGATGLIGSEILQALLAEPGIAKVLVLARRPLPVTHAKLQTLVVDFTRLPSLEERVDEAYLALGTTIKVAGSQEAFRAVDLDANLAVAKAAMAAGCSRIALVSAVGANARSSVFYNRVKGELEDALKAMKPGALVIAQPSLLMGDRKRLNQPTRAGEVFAAPIMKLLSPVIPRIYRPVRGRAVARSLVNTLPNAQGVVVLASDQLANTGAG